MCTIIEYYEAFIKAGIENGAPEYVIEKLKTLYEVKNEFTIWKAPEELYSHWFDIKVSLAMIVQEHSNGYEDWYKAMKYVFETLQLKK